MLDVYVHTPDAAPTSTAAAFPARNYSVGSPWSQRIEVQGFAGPVWVDPDGDGKGTVTAIVSSTVDRHDHRRAGRKLNWARRPPGGAFTVVLTGQDGFSPDAGARFHPDAGRLQLRRVRAGRLVADLPGQPGLGAEGART